MKKFFVLILACCFFILNDTFSQINNDSIKFVCDLINPSEELKNNWIYQIVCNKVNDIDVDKIDYILRDSYHIGLPLQGEFSRLISMVKVCNYKDNKVLAWNKKLQYEIFLLFSSRYRLHKQVYTHHTVKSFEYLIIYINTFTFLISTGSSLWE